MPRDSGRNRNRSRREEQSPRRELSEYEVAQKKVRELEEQLQEKDLRLAANAKRLEQNYGMNVEFAAVNYSPRYSPEASPNNEYYMSPIRIGVANDRFDDSSPIRINSPDPYRDGSPPHFDYPRGEYPRAEYQFENSNGIKNQFLYEHPPGYQSFDRQPPPFFHEDVEVRVDEMPKWPMHGSPPPNTQCIPEQPQSFSPTPIWRHQQEVQVDPMPVFPMDDEDDKEDALAEAEKRREEKVRLQMMMIARQAELAEEHAKSISSSGRPSGQEKKRSGKDNDRDEKREARHAIGKIRDKVLLEMREKEKEKELKKREIEREKRHALRRKKDEAEAAKKREARRNKEDFVRQAEADEFFLKYLKPAIGKIECEATRIEGKSPSEYVAECHAVNIPKELLYGSKVDETKGDCYRGAITSYVDKLVKLGVIEDKKRRIMRRIEKFPKFLAELVEPLCNDIAIFGTQISVTDARDMRSSFDSFAKEKSSEFWNNEENRNSLTEFLKRFEKKRKTSRSRSRSRDRKRNGSDRHRTHSRDRHPKTPSPSNEESLKMLFASVGNGVTPGHQNSSNLHQIPVLHSTPSPANNYMQQQPSLPSLMAMDVAPPAPPSQPPMFNQYMHPSTAFYPSQPQQQYDTQIMNGYSQYQQPMMVQQQQPQMFASYQQSSVAYPANRSRREDDSELMDEIFS